MEIDLAYGKGRLRVELPDHITTEVIEPRYVEGFADQVHAVRDALANPVSHPPLRHAVQSHQKVAIIFSDITRATPYPILLPALLEHLEHIPDDRITLFCATGTHRQATRYELNTILGREMVERFRIVQNDASKDELYQYVGTTVSGNRILLHREILEHDLCILTGFIEPHFFAGFSGGGKALMPGMAHEGSIRRNHSIRNLEAPGTRWGQTYGNPLWEEITEGAEFAEPLFLLNIALNRDKEITGVFAGDLREAHRMGCDFVRETSMVGFDRPFDIVLTSNSGYPLDLNVYQSVKGMSAAAQVVREGGAIIVAAECWDGIPSGSDYETILQSVEDVAELMTFIKLHEMQFKDTWQVYFQALIQMQAEVYLFSTLDEYTVRKTLLNPSGNMEQLVNALVEKTGDECRICVLPEGPQTIPFLL